MLPSRGSSVGPQRGKARSWTPYVSCTALNDERRMCRGGIVEPIEVQMRCNYDVADINAAMSWRGGAPNMRRYSRLNWDGLSYPTRNAA